MLNSRAPLCTAICVGIYLLVMNAMAPAQVPGNDSKLPARKNPNPPSTLPPPSKGVSNAGTIGDMNYQRGPNVYYIPGAVTPTDASTVALAPGQLKGPTDPAVREQIARRGTNDDLRWDQNTWLYWWAWNRDAILSQVLARRRIASPSPPAALAKAAAEALTTAIQNADPAVRIESALALARSRDAKALPVLLSLSSDPIAEVRYTSGLAVGLLNAAGSERALLAALSNTDPATLLGAVAGIGMLDTPSKATSGTLIATYQSHSEPSEIRRMILWCLRIHRSPAGAALVRNVLQQESSPLLVSEAVLTLAPDATTTDGRLLGEICTYALFVLNDRGTFPGNPARGGVGPAADMLKGLHGEPSMLVRRDIRARAKAFANTLPCLRALSGVALSESEAMRLRNPQLRESVAALKDTAAARLLNRQLQTLYTACLMALGQAPPAAIDGANTVAVQVWKETIWQNDPQNDPAVTRMGVVQTRIHGEIVGLLTGEILPDAFISVPPPYAEYQGPAMLAYAQSSIHDPGGAALPALMDVWQTGPREQQLNIDAPNEWIRRGFAAIALGLQDTRRPGAAAADPRAPSEWDPVYHDLITAAARPDAPDVRAAYVMAPALAGRAGVPLLLNTPGPNGERSGLAKDSPFVYAHLLLSRAMLGDPTAAAEAAKLLGPPQPHLDLNVEEAPPRAATAPSVAAKPTNAQLNDFWRRSMLLTALAVSGDKQNIPALNAQWGRDPWLTYEAARAMGWCHAFENIAPLAAFLTDHADAPNAALAARTLGELLDPDHPSHLSRLLIGNCYVQLMSPDPNHFTWPADRVEPMSHLLADPPLFRFLTAGLDPTNN